MGDKKSNFSVTCALLSQYLKNKGSLGDLGLDTAPRSLDHRLAKGILGKSGTPTILSLLPGVDVSEDHEDCPKSMDLFPHHTGFNTVAVSETMKEQAKLQPLTIFYDGKVLVFDNFPADRANDLFQMASKESIANTTSVKVAQNVEFKVPPPPVIRAEANSKTNTMISSTSSSSQAAVATENNLSKPANASDMPIARRNSLHRFLEKRKDRINTMAPYQVDRNGSSAQNAAKPEDGPSWLGLGPHNSKPDNSSGSSK